MSESLLRHLYASVDRCEWPEVAGCFRADGVYERSGVARLEGAERIERYYREERGIASCRHTLDGVLVHGDRGAVWGHMEGVDDAGAPVSAVFSDIFELGHGGIALRRSFFFAQPAAS
jgi:ketosteroid isomerase-like protein